eukprot:TRINITY_DN7817_c0_g1_i5.p1 TRINITY_DN7817_c0_g1~~TRINITY_DN7817_c0_g1_i5.p1  ORF type:complete len:846 (-),score=160.16 TRINITY_DN7817_c0_g1_i5:120-2657(-)
MSPALAPRSNGQLSMPSPVDRTPPRASSASGSDVAFADALALDATSSSTTVPGHQRSVGEPVVVHRPPAGTSHQGGPPAPHLRYAPSSAGDGAPPESSLSTSVGNLSSQAMAAAIPQAFRCPLSGQIMRDPVATTDGHVYERSAIEDWFWKGHRYSPVTGLQLSGPSLTPQLALQAAIRAFVAHPAAPKDAGEAPSLEETYGPASVRRDGLSCEVILEDEPSFAYQNNLSDSHEVGASSSRASTNGMGPRNGSAESGLRAPVIGRGTPPQPAEKRRGSSSNLNVSANGGSRRSPSPSSRLYPGTKNATRGELPRRGSSQGSRSPSPERSSEQNGVAERSALAPPTWNKAPRNPSPARVAKGVPASPQNRTQGAMVPGAQSEALENSGPMSQRTHGGASSNAGSARGSPRRTAFGATAPSPSQAPSAASSMKSPPRMRPSPSAPSSKPSRLLQQPTPMQARVAPPATTSERASLPLGNGAGTRRTRTPSPKRQTRSTGLASSTSSRSSLRMSGSSQTLLKPVERSDEAVPEQPSRQHSVAGLHSVSTDWTASVSHADFRPEQDAPTPSPVSAAVAGKDLMRRPEPASPEDGPSALRPSTRPDAVDDAGRTPLMHAAGEGDPEALKMQLKQGAPIDARDDCRCTALMYAATYGHVAAVKCLVEHGAEVEATSKDGWTPLITAAYNGHLEVVCYLLACGARIEAADERGWTSLMHVAFNGDNRTLLCLLDGGAQVDALDQDGRTALVYAAFNGHLENVRCLLDASAKANKEPEAHAPQPSVESARDTALLFAAIHGHGEVVRMLLEAAPASPETRHAALKLAADHGHHHVVEILVRRSAVELQLVGKA